MSKPLPCAVLLAITCLLVTRGGIAQESIFDPENPMTPPADSQTLGDSPNDDSEGELIFDPDNPLSASNGEPSAEETSAPSPSRLVIFSGQWLGQVYLDTQMKDTGEDVYMLRSRLELRVLLDISEKWRAVVEGRMEMRAWGGRDTGPVEDPLLENDGSLQGEWDPTLRDAYVSGRFGNFFMTIGNQIVLWGAGTISNPASVINPMDRRGATADWPAERRTPVPAIDLMMIVDQLSFEAVLVPFFIPARLDLLGTDWALLPPIVGQSYDLYQLFRLLPGVDQTFLARIQEDFIVTEFPTVSPQNMSAGGRIKSRYGGVDIGLGYYFGWDRLPTVNVTGDFATFITDLLAGNRADLPINSYYERLHSLELDLVAPLGPVALRIESVFNPQRTAYVGDLQANRFPLLTSVLGLSYEPSESLFLQVEGVYAHTFDVPDGERLMLNEPDDFSMIFAGMMRFDVFNGLRGSAVGNLGFSLLGRYSFSNKDYVITPAVFYGVRDFITLSFGALLYGGPPVDEGLTLGGIYADNDQVYFSISVDF